MEFLINLMGADKVALGSDYPFPLGELVPGKMIEEMSSLDKKTKEHLFHGAALSWLNKELTDFKN